MNFIHDTQHNVLVYPMGSPFLLQHLPDAKRLVQPVRHNRPGQEHDTVRADLDLVHRRRFP